MPKRSPHGADLLGFGRKYRKSEEEILDFSSNINPFGAPPAVTELYRKSAEELSKYPDAYADQFCKTVSDLYGLRPKQVLAGNGSLEILDLAFRALRPKKVLLAEPCFNEYRRLAVRGGAKITSVKLREAAEFKFSLETLLKYLPGKDFALLGHPNNPTGTAFSRDEMKLFLKAARREKVFVVLDEAFADWTPGISMAAEAGQSGLLMVRSLTKFYALAGIRAGYGLGPASLIEKMKQIQGPWTCNRIAQKLSAAAFGEKLFAEQSRRWFQAESLWLRKQIQDLGVFKVYPSQANFFLIRSRVSLARFWDFCGKKGLYVRRSDGFRGLDKSFFRIAVKKREENEMLIQTLKEYTALFQKKNSINYYV